jgi:hypothetical protein
VCDRAAVTAVWTAAIVRDVSARAGGASRKDSLSGSAQDQGREQGVARKAPPTTSPRDFAVETLIIASFYAGLFLLYELITWVAEELLRRLLCRGHLLGDLVEGLDDATLQHLLHQQRDDWHRMVAALEPSSPAADSQEDAR